MKYTAVLLYPDYASTTYGEDSYIESAEAESAYEAAQAIRDKASAANNGEIPADDFLIVAVFQGEPVLELNAANFDSE